MGRSTRVSRLAVDITLATDGVLDLTIHLQYIHSGMKFDWDEAKRQENIARHRIDFMDVPAVFDGPMLVRLDTRRDYGEDRWIGMGLLRNMVAVVIYVEWEDDETVRIISARRATQYEDRQFHQSIAH